jgi:hypothetical protein
VEVRAMSRSRRRFPVRGCVSSAKLDKQRDNRVFRRRNRRLLILSEDEEKLLLFHQLSDTWLWRQEYKFWFDPQEHPDALRK